MPKTPVGFSSSKPGTSIFVRAQKHSNRAPIGNVEVDHRPPVSPSRIDVTGTVERLVSVLDCNRNVLPIDRPMLDRATDGSLNV